MRRRRSDDPSSWLTTVRELMKQPTWKLFLLALAFGGTLFLAFGTRSEVNDLKPQVKTLKEDVSGVQKSFSAVKRQVGSFAEDLNEGIQDAVRIGIKRGVAAALREVNDGP